MAKLGIAGQIFEVYKHRMTEEYMEFTSEILFSEEFLKRLTMPHHGIVSVYEHCLNVSLTAYELAKKEKLPTFMVRNVIIGGLLHDFYPNDWHRKIKWSSEKRGLAGFRDRQLHHGIHHPEWASENASHYFPHLMNRSIKETIEAHMYPLTLNKKHIIDTNICARIVNRSDKIVSKEVARNTRNNTIEAIKNSKNKEELFAILRYEKNQILAYVGLGNTFAPQIYAPENLPEIVNETDELNFSEYEFYRLLYCTDLSDSYTKQIYLPEHIDEFEIKKRI